MNDHLLSNYIILIIEWSCEFVNIFMEITIKLNSWTLFTLSEIYVPFFFHKVILLDYFILAGIWFQ